MATATQTFSPNDSASVDVEPEEAAVVQAALRLSRPRFAFLVFLGVYPLITAIIYLVFPLTEGWAVWQRTLIIVPVMVTAMVWGLIPAVQHYGRSWIMRA